MTDWKPQISYSYNPSYHAYAYGLMYQPGPDQNHGNQLGCWSEAAVTDMSGYNPGVTQVYYAAAARSREESSPGSPEQHAASGHHHYQGSGLVYLGDTQASRVVLPLPHRTVGYDAQDDEVGRARSDSASDSESHTSPDSWSSSSNSSRDGNAPQTQPHIWVKKELDCEEFGNKRAADPGDVSNILPKESENFSNVEACESPDHVTVLQHAPVATPNKTSTPTTAPKAKVRAAFSESQMNALVQRFSVQRYLTPAEMKNLAEMTGLTYKQVKTWFQNRRMKLRRHQKDNSWVSERYTLNKDVPIHGNVYSNIPPHMPPYRGEPQVQYKEHYNQHMMEQAFKKAAPQNLAFYLAMGNAAGSAGYRTWPAAAAAAASSSQTPVHGRPQTGSWPIAPSVGHYEYNPSTFHSATTHNTGHDTSFENKEEELVST